MKVVFLIDSLGAGGAERSLALLAPEIARSGVEVGFLTLYSAKQGFEDEVRDQGIPAETLEVRRFPCRVREARRYLRLQRPDIVHTAMFAADQVGRIAAIGLDVKVISSLVNVPRSPDRMSVSPWKVRVVNAVDACTAHLMVDRFQAVTSGVAELYTKAYRLDPQSVGVVERGRSIALLGERTEARRRLARQALGIPADGDVIIAAGRQEHQKAHVDLIRAMNLLVPRHPDIHLLIAGREGSASDAIQSLMREISPDVAERVHLLGHRSDVADLLVAADVMALPSLFEGTAGIALEAMALRTPIVSTTLEGMQGILVDGENSLLVPTRDPEALAAAITTMLSDRELGARLAASAYHTFVERFTLEAAAERMVALYRDVLADDRK